MTHPKVSVIILTYNRNDMVLKSVGSVLNQTFRDYELLVLDDGSTDDTLSNLARIRDPRLTVLVLEHSGHISNLRNTGLQSTSGKYIAFLDSDDHWVNDHLHTQVNILEKDETLGFVTSDISVYNDQNVIFQGIYGSATSGILKGNFFQKVMSGQLIVPAASALLFRRECLKTTGLIDEKFVTGDFEFSCRLAYHFNGIRCIDPLVSIYRHSENHSDLWELHHYREVLITLNQFYISRKISKDLYKERSFEIHYKMGLKYWQRKKHFNAIKEFLISYRLKPVHWRIIIKNVRKLLPYN
jgi:glycosyltransferase involved in cell wall biosynthesis